MNQDYQSFSTVDESDCEVVSTSMTAGDKLHFDPEQFADGFVSRVARTHRSVGDVFFLNTVFLWHKGVNSRTEGGSKPDVEQVIAYLKSVYDIKEDEDNSLSEDSVTLERIHFAFPVVACKAAAVGVEQRKARSQLNKVMAIIECPAFARFCSSLVELDDAEASVFVDAYCWGQYLHICKATAGIKPDTNVIREKALKWKPKFSFENLAEIFEQKLSFIREIDDLMLDEFNIELGVAELHRSLQSAACLPNVNFIVDQAVYETPFTLVVHGKAHETFLDNYEVLHFSGALLCYLTSIKKRLCRDNRVSHRRFRAEEHLPQLFAVLKEAALGVLNSTPDRIIELMQIAGLKVCWSGLVHAAHERVRPIIRNLFLVDVPKHMTRWNMAKLGLELSFTESTLFEGCYPNLIRDWASNWRSIDVVREC